MGGNFGLVGVSELLSSHQIFNRFYVTLVEWVLNKLPIVYFNKTPKLY